MRAFKVGFDVLNSLLDLLHILLWRRRERDDGVLFMTSWRVPRDHHPSSCRPRPLLNVRPHGDVGCGVDLKIGHCSSRCYASAGGDGGLTGFTVDVYCSLCSRLCNTGEGTLIKGLIRSTL